MDYRTLIIYTKINPTFKIAVVGYFIVAMIKVMNSENSYQEWHCYLMKLTSVYWIFGTGFQKSLKLQARKALGCWKQS